MLNKKILSSLVLASVTVSGLAFAGAKYSRDVYVNSYSFAGSFGTTRNSASTSSWLECSINPYGSYSCSAYDGVTYKSCSGSDPQIRGTINAMGGEDDMYVEFSGGTCTYISVSKRSINEPKR